MGGQVAFVEQRHQQAYAGAMEEFRRGGRLAKTGPELPLATMVDVELPGAGHRILYLFDPAGEHFAGASQVESLRYLDHGEALLFVVEPLPSWPELFKPHASTVPPEVSARLKSIRFSSAPVRAAQHPGNVETQGPK